MRQGAEVLQGYHAQILRILETPGDARQRWIYSQWSTELARNCADPIALCDGYVLFFRLPSRPIFSHGMHVFGCRDGILDAGDDRDGRLRSVQDFVRETVATQKSWTPEECYCDTEGRRFRLKEAEPVVSAPFLGPGHPMFNPYGCWRLVPM